jgi:hypothetical protein
VKVPTLLLLFACLDTLLPDRSTSSSLAGHPALTRCCRNLYRFVLLPHDLVVHIEKSVKEVVAKPLALLDRVG